MQAWRHASIKLLEGKMVWVCLMILMTLLMKDRILFIGNFVIEVLTKLDIWEVIFLLFSFYGNLKKIEEAGAIKKFIVIFIFQ